LFDRLMIEAGNSDCLVSEIAYLNPKRSLSKNEVARYIDMSQLSTSGAFPSGWKMKPFTGGMRFSNGDTLLARITPCLENGKTAYIDFLDNKEVAFGSTEYIVLAPKEGIPPEYLYCLARYPAFVDYAVKNMNGSSGRQRVSADIIGQFVMPRPSERNLRDFGSVVSALFMKMKNNSLENIRLASLRDSLLPKLMSGEIDVSALQI
ncbi:MAG: restriction endonuclease subunit S, partial [Hydrogeniiclostridium mannosilyticum]